MHSARCNSPVVCCSPRSRTPRAHPCAHGLCAPNPNTSTPAPLLRSVCPIATSSSWPCLQVALLASGGPGCVVTAGAAWDRRLPRRRSTSLCGFHPRPTAKAVPWGGRLHLSRSELQRYISTISPCIVIPYGLTRNARRVPRPAFLSPHGFPWQGGWSSLTSIAFIVAAARLVMRRSHPHG